MEKHRCKLCFKSFVNGRALGGHMRSHMATLTIPPKTQQVIHHHHHHHHQQLEDETEFASSASSSPSSSSGEEEEDKALYYELRENPKKSFRLVDPEFSFAVDAGSVVQDRESETESCKNPSRRRSKRNRKSSIIGDQRNLQNQQHLELKKHKLSKSSKAESPPEPEPVSSVSDTTPEEDVALCLMMLSRDIWMKEQEMEVAEEQEEDDEEPEKSLEESDSEEFKFPNRSRGRYQCGTCKKMFRSYQALGGHRASHKKIRGCTPSSSFAVTAHEAESKPGNAGTSTVDRRIHECPVCFRVFGSGQALGGHKRSHISGSVIATNTVKFAENMIDLNFPAPIDDDDMSQVELSAVSDAEFVDPTK